MKIKKNCKASSSDFWYDLTDGGYLEPEEICEKKEDAEKVISAIEMIVDFQNSCEEQIKDFFQ